MKTLVMIAQTILEVRRTLHETRLGALEPYFFGLILLSFLLYLVHAVSPLAPFVYSLF
jgi:hypothetical protein